MIIIHMQWNDVDVDIHAQIVLQLSTAADKIVSLQDGVTLYNIYNNRSLF